MAVTGADICRSALYDINAFDANDNIGNDDLIFVLGIVNRIIDNWNAERPAVYCETLNTYTLTPSLSPHTIGPTGTFVVAQRPERIDDAQLVFLTANKPTSDIQIRDAEWYAALSVSSLTSSVPTDLYYEKAWPNGNLYFYPIPTTAYQVQLLYRTVLSALTLNGTFSLPPGYQDALTRTASADIAVAYEKAPMMPLLLQLASAAQMRIFSNNAESPHIATIDSGMPSGQRPMGNYLTGWWRKS